MAEPGSWELDKLLNNAWARYHEGDKTAIDDVYNSIMPFCLRICSKSCGKYISLEDDEASIAGMALIKAFDNYNPARGRFLVFLGQVIKTRFIDYKRQEKKSRLIPFSFLTQKSGYEKEIIDDELIETIIDDLARKQEIEHFKELLASFSISLADLLECSPRQDKSRERAKEIAGLIAGDEELTSSLISKKVLPIKLLEDRYQVNRKYADRYRKFIIADVLIIVYELSYLMPYVMPRERGGDYVQG